MAGIWEKFGHEQEAVRFVVEIPPEVEREMTPAVRAFVASLMSLIEQLRRRDEEREARIAELELQVNQAEKFQRAAAVTEPTSAAESCQPEQKSPQADEPPKRKRGGQPGHKKHTRALRPSAECDEVIMLRPEACWRCGKALRGTDEEPWRHQAWEIPEIQPTVINDIV